MARIESAAWMRGLLIVMGLFASLAIVANAEEITYAAHIKRIVDAQCASCHGKSAPEHGAFKKGKEGYKKQGLGPKMDSYAHLASYTGWPDSGAVMRRLDDGMNTKDGKPGSRYQYLGVTEEERQRNLQIFKAWVGNWSLKRFPEMTKEDLAGILVKY